MWLWSSPVTEALGLLAAAAPNETNYVGAADLFATSSFAPAPPLPVTVDLLAGGAFTVTATRHLRRLDGAPPITDLNASTLDAMWDLERSLSPLATTTAGGADMAAVLCARKRPWHFPLRHPRTRPILGPLSTVRADALGRFSYDMQAAAFLLTDNSIRRLLDNIRDHGCDHIAAVGTRHGAAAGLLIAENLRLLDAVLLNASIPVGDAYLDGAVADSVALNGCHVHA